MARYALVHGAAHGATLARLLPRLDAASITALVEPNAQRAAELAEQLGVKFTASSIDELHQQHDAEFDTWLASTETGWLIVPQANRPLQLRPELGSNHAEGWMWGQQFRFLPSVQTVKSSLSSGQLGEPGLVRIHHWQTTAAGSARLAMLAQLDLACWLIGNQPTVLFAQAPRTAEVKEASRDDYLQVHLGFDPDCMAIIDGCTSLAAGDAYYSLSVIGSSGAAYADDHHNMQLQFGGEETRALPTSQAELTLLAMLREYEAATSNARPPSCGLADWNRAWQLLSAAEVSLRTGEAVSLTQENP